MNRPDEVRDVMEQLASLAPGKSDASAPAPEALARLQQRLNEGARRPLPPTGRLLHMLRRRYAFATVLVLALVVVAVALPPVRAAASDFLGLFRVQKFAAISVSPAQLQRLENLAEQGLYPGELEMIEEPGPHRPVSGLDEAHLVTGWQPQTATALPAPDQVFVSDGGSGRLTVDVQSARAIVQAAGVDPQLLPESLDGAVVDVTIYPAVQQVWDDGLMLVETESPQVDYPDDVNPEQLGEALLQVLGMTPGEARRLAQQIDWNSTLVFPVPENVATFNETTVGGNSALALSSVDGEESSLLWQQDNVLFFLVGERSVAELREIAESVR
ncbi:MAG TPA: hypothetical protein VK879_03350 [Candidatus Sulfomarinibacteraceae bacterium]|nr:hypothetical protein [Candidatus Sulfomarinibacteraceae bacterium]